MPLAGRCAADTMGDAKTINAVEGSLEIAETTALKLSVRKPSWPILRLFSPCFTVMVNCGDIHPAK